MYNIYYYRLAASTIFGLACKLKPTLLNEIKVEVRFRGGPRGPPPSLSFDFSTEFLWQPSQLEWYCSISARMFICVEDIERCCALAKIFRPPFLDLLIPIASIYLTARNILLSTFRTTLWISWAVGLVMTLEHEDKKIGLSVFFR